MNDDIFDELLRTFRDEAAEAFDLLAVRLDELRAPELEAREEALQDALRIAHNMKGASSIVGIEELAQLCHRMEDVLGTFRRACDPPGEEVLADLLAALTLCQKLAEGQKRPNEAADAHRLLGRWAPARDETAEDEEAMPVRPPRRGRSRAEIPSEPPLSTDAATTESAAEADAAAPTGELQPARPAARVPRSAAERAAEDTAGTLRVETARLDRLMAYAEELLIVQARQAERLGRLRDLRKTLEDAARGSDPGERAALIQVGRGLAEEEQLDQREARELSNLATQVSEAMKSVRMLPLISQGPFWRRVVRETAQDVGRRVRLEIEVGDTELDKEILDALREPFLHLLRNAVDHGIESPAERRAAGKEEEGRITIRAEMAGTNVQVSVDDDGRGIEPQKIAESALRRGLVTPERLDRMSDDEKRALLFRSGFSTAERVSRLSGRGVGLDVVARRLQDLGGHVRLRRGRSDVGTGFDLILPLSLLSLRGLVVRSGSSVCALPIESVERTFRADRRALRRLDGVPMLEMPGEEPLKLLYLATFLEEAPSTEATTLTVVVVARAGLRLGLVVGEIHGEQEFVTHRLPWNLQSVPGIGAAFIRPDGSVATVLDVGYLFFSDRGTEEPSAVRLEETRAVRVLVVDDSLTSRTLERNILVRAGYHVEVAVDGEEAWKLLEEQPFDLVVADVDMPRLDGFELTRRIRRSAELRRLPVVLVTSLANEEQIREGARAGADEYIVKGQFEQRKLLETVARHL